MKPSMKLWSPLILILLGGLSTSGLYAQEIIALQESDLDRLGIVLMPVRPIDDTVGDSFPATVVNSPMTSSLLNVPYGGILQSWLIEPGQNVTSGDAMAMIYSQELLGVQNDWHAARITLQQAEFELEKDTMLLDQGIISRQRLVQTQSQFEEARNRKQILDARLSLAGFTVQDLSSATLNNAAPGTYTLRSPVSGSVDHLMQPVGTFVDSNLPIARIGSQERWLSAELPARAAANLVLGQMLRIEGSNVPLTLRQKDYEVSTQSQTLGILASFNGSPELMVGQVLTLIIPSTRTGVLVPGDAVVHNGNATSVYVRSDEGFEVRSIQLRPAGADYLATEGLVAGEEIAIRGTAILKGIQLGLGGE
jgi:cobalt-zinc-cadmium efflux system membrane fusion protein